MNNISINYLKGDATEPTKKPAIICHVCNDIGGWGRGFVLALSKKCSLIAYLSDSSSNNLSL